MASINPGMSRGRHRRRRRSANYRATFEVEHTFSPAAQWRTTSSIAQEGLPSATRGSHQSRGPRPGCKEWMEGSAGENFNVAFGLETDTDSDTTASDSICLVNHLSLFRRLDMN